MTTEAEKLTHILWNIRYHLKRLNEKALEPDGLEPHVISSNTRNLHGYYNQLMVLEMNESMRQETNTRAFKRLFNTIGLVALAS